MFSKSPRQFSGWTSRSHVHLPLVDSRAELRSLAACSEPSYRLLMSATANYAQTGLVLVTPKGRIRGHGGASRSTPAPNGVDRSSGLSSSHDRANATRRSIAVIRPRPFRQRPRPLWGKRRSVQVPPPPHPTPAPQPIAAPRLLCLPPPTDSLRVVGAATTYARVRISNRPAAPMSDFVSGSRHGSARRRSGARFLFAAPPRFSGRTWTSSRSMHCPRPRYIGTVTEGRNALGWSRRISVRCDTGGAARATPVAAASRSNPAGGAGALSAQRREVQGRRRGWNVDEGGRGRARDADTCEAGVRMLWRGTGVRDTAALDVLRRDEEARRRERSNGGVRDSSYAILAPPYLKRQCRRLLHERRARCYCQRVLVEWPEEPQVVVPVATGVRKEGTWGGEAPRV
ncbi:hypothetical protein K438DRAFT_1769807 [Mycena galopus ATCC 62051]|nr:hypothetical protein K438DRAFT_1769807 [Mycena galopus ATCC 62051]